MELSKIEIAEKMLDMRIAQMFLNEKIKQKKFKIPIHLAMGHEALALSVREVFKDDDKITLTHRNIHYNLAFSNDFKRIFDEFSLKETGLGNARLGSMNLSHEDAGICYTSSILGNNLCVGAGIALADKFKKKSGVTFIVTGDGAIEEGAFYESLLFCKSHSLPAIFIVENNEWSLGSHIEERRCPISLKSLSDTFVVPFYKLEGNDIYAYKEKLSAIRNEALSTKNPVIIEVTLKSLGDWRMKTEEYPDGKFINYHAGSTPAVEMLPWPVIDTGEGDPIHKLLDHFSKDELMKIADRLATKYEELER